MDFEVLRQLNEAAEKINLTAAEAADILIKMSQAVNAPAMDETSDNHDIIPVLEILDKKSEKIGVNIFDCYND